jgi:hypothetical protein
MRKRSVSGQFRAVYLSISRIRGPVIRRVLSLLLAVTVAAAPAVLTAPAQAAAGANLYFVQGLPGRSLDISIDGHQVATAVAGGKLPASEWSQPGKAGRW